MAVYKVPQDVEAEDKLLGPFSFRQFLYLIVAIMGVAIGWGLAKILVPLAIIPLPIVVLFGALALPLRKDQPMEVYLAALLSFYLKPRKRLWKADGVQSLVEIIAPKTVEEHRTNGLSEDEAQQRISYLATLVDSRGWAVRGVDTPQAENAMQDDIFFEAQQAEDVLDDTSALTNIFDNMIGKADSARRQNAVNLIKTPATSAQSATTPAPYPEPISPLSQLQPAPITNQPPALNTTVSFNPYPESMRQSLIHPASAQPAPTMPVQPQPAPIATSNTPVSPGIMNLANNSDLSIETMEREAKRIREKEEGLSDSEVVISLR